MFQYAGEYAKASLCQATNGKMYGMTSSCCVFGAYGIFFQYDPATKEYDKLIDFNDTLNGSDPQGGLIQASDGKLYGLTCKGGLGNWGVIFQYDPVTAVFKKKHDFDDTNGSYPQGNLLQATDGKLYGLTNTGGASDFGVLFQFDPATGVYSKKADFDGELTGSNPLGALIQTKNGKFYGLTSGGGKNGYGCLFEYDALNSKLIKKVDFEAGANGGRPYGSLVEAADGNLYGLTTVGGSNDFGVLFQFDPTSSNYTVKINFDDVALGASPQSSLLLAKNGKLYGVTEYGGTQSEGVLFEYDPATSSFSKKFDFNNNAGLTGKYPIGALIQASDGLLYGMNYTGGIGGVGALYKYDPATAAYSKEFDFHASSNGNVPAGALIQGSDKMIYGITQSGGLNNQGTIFQYDPALDDYKKKFDFDRNASGAIPAGNLVQTGDGRIYGTTLEGGTNDKGVLFEFDPATAAYKIKVTFDGTNGSYPSGELIQLSNGKIYGMTREGGKSNAGVIFQFDPTTSAYVKKFEFDDNGNGKYPEGGLTQAADGKLYGLTTTGGSITTIDFPDGFGALFQFDPTTDNYTKKIDFDGSAMGRNPAGTLAKAVDGKLYGMASYGGKTDANNSSGYGVLFQFDPATAVITTKLEFDGIEKGSNPNGSLLAASNGNLYGVTFTGGLYGMGVLFQFDPLTSTYAKKNDLAQPTGKLANYAKLLEISLINSIATNQSLQMNMEVYPNPSKEQITLSLNQNLTDASVKIITVSGQCVLEKYKLSGSRFVLNIADLLSGVYFVEVAEKGITSRTKFVKE